VRLLVYMSLKSSKHKAVPAAPQLRVERAQSKGTSRTCFCKFEVILTVHHRYYVEIKCQLDATDDFYCRFYCMLNMFRAILCPSSGAREYYTDGRCLWYLVLWFSGCPYGVELKVMCPVCRLQSSLQTSIDPLLRMAYTF